MDTIESLYLPYRRPVFSCLYGLSHNIQAAEDLTQETFLQVLDGRTEQNLRKGNRIFPRFPLILIHLIIWPFDLLIRHDSLYSAQNEIIMPLDHFLDI